MRRKGPAGPLDRGGCGGMPWPPQEPHERADPQGREPTAQTPPEAPQRRFWGGPGMGDGVICQGAPGGAPCCNSDPSTGIDVSKCDCRLRWDRAGSLAHPPGGPCNRHGPPYALGVRM